MDEFFENSVMKIRTFNNIYPFRSHLHCEPELFYLLDGQVEIKVNAKTYILQKDDFVFIFPFCLHEFKLLTPNVECLPAYGIIPRIDLVDKYVPLFHSHLPENPVIRSDELHPDVRFAIQRIIETATAQEDDSVVSAYLQVAFTRTIPQLALEKQAAKNGGMLIQNVLQYINQHCSERLTLEGVAATFFVSRAHLSNLFSNKVKMSFNDFLNSLRVNKAQALLSQTDRSITDILFECGFVSTRSFNRNFMKFTQMTPSEYRRATRNHI